MREQTMNLLELNPQAIFKEQSFGIVGKEITLQLR